MRKAKLIYNLAALLMLGVAVLIMYPLQLPIFEKISQYSVHFIFLYIMLAMLFLIIDIRRLMFASLIAAGLLCLFLKKHSNVNLVLPEENKEAGISIAHINLANAGPDIKEFLLSLQNIDVDVFSFQEYTPFWKDILTEEMQSDYPYSISLTRIDPFGLAIYSKVTLNKIDTLLPNDTPVLVCSAALGRKSIDIYSTYVSPSINKTGANKAKTQLETISTTISKRKNPVIVSGEFNDVYWSNKIRTFTSHNFLANSRRNTTPSSFKVPYDHIFYSQDLECTLLKDLINLDNNRIGILGRYQFKSLVKLSKSNSALGNNQ